MNRTRAALAVLPLLALPLSACGGTGSSSASGSATPSEIYDVGKQARIYEASATESGAVFDLIARTQAFHEVADEDLAGTDFITRPGKQQETFAKHICANYDHGYDWVKNLAYSQDNEPTLNGTQMGRLGAISTAAFCPSYNDEVPQ